MNWIDIKKELPKYYEPVLVCYRYKGSGYGKSVCWMAIGDDEDYIWTIAFTDTVIENITHWMELPKTPYCK
jgi:hypothetical protein|tara:strand:+ start:218 stop:430 length:213 start_codon:yes stop_codon:yes gene_type:complete